MGNFQETFIKTNQNKIFHMHTFYIFYGNESNKENL